MKLTDIIKKVENKKSKFFIYCLNSKGNIITSVTYNYELVMTLRKEGYDAYILHEDKYVVPEFLGTNYTDLPHVSMSEVRIGGADFLMLPEVNIQPFYDDLKEKNIKALPCEVVVISQVHDFVHYSINLTRRWSDFGITHAICSSEHHKKFVDETMGQVNTHTVELPIPKQFKPSDKPQKPYCLIYSQSKKDAEQFVKIFTNRSPFFSFMPFQNLNGVNHIDDVASMMSEACCLVWLDEKGTSEDIPLKAMASGVPVIGVVPNIIPTWMGENENGAYKTKDNGIWVMNKFDLPIAVESYIDAWLRDSEELSKVDDIMTKTTSKYTDERFKSQLLNAIGVILSDRLDTLKMIEEKNAKRNEQ